MTKTREELVAALEGARTARDVELAEVSERHNVIIKNAEQAVVDFDNNAGVEEEVEELVASEEDITVDASDTEEVEEPTDLPSEQEKEVVDDTEDVTSPTAEEEEILRRAAAIEAKYQK